MSLGKLPRGLWKAYSFMGDILTGKGALLGIFLGIFAYKAHEANPDAGLLDNLKAFYEPVFEDTATIIPGIGLFVADAFNAAAELTMDYILPGAGFVLKSIFSTSAGLPTEEQFIHPSLAL